MWFVCPSLKEKSLADSKYEEQVTCLEKKTWFTDEISMGNFNGTAIFTDES